jgi:hypothetical protein
MSSVDDLEQKRLKKFLERRHPEYEGNVHHWKFLLQTYEGGRQWFPDNVFRYIREGDRKFNDRVKRAYRFNHTREVVDLVDKHLFKQNIARSEDAPDPVKKFWKTATLNSLSIKDFVRRVSKLSSIFGRVWIVVDNTNVGEAISLADEKDGKVRTYAYTVTPIMFLDASYDESGELNWALIHEQVREDSDPINSNGEMVDRYRLWTREDWTLFTVKKEGNKKVVIKEGPFTHNLGVVPVFAADCFVSDEPYNTPALIADVAYLDRASANYLSNLDAIIQDQTFSQLVIPAQGIPAGEDAHDKLIEMGTESAFTYDAAGGGQPFYLSPDVKQAELIITVINKIINEIYHTVGLAGERTKDDNSQGIDNSSGVAKAYDFERVNSLLAAKADSLEMIENRLAWFVAKWNGVELADEERFVSYPDNFDVRGLYDEFEIAARLSLIEAPDLVRRQQMEMLIDKLFPELKKELREKMLSELKQWPPEPEPVEGGVSNKGSIAKEGKNTLANKMVNSKK